ncbi:sensor histidine kinase [Pleionea sp. CnH1-48]|uniref:sensor histidine kinase n=1 Tax=Pleionea sp. CnH1-48 TaxID=2954494 RepID=UPI0020971281|nr:histidine kinase [Pleionea sp. CnH1-48]MCO7226051.1 histidine kinase [Pleionea sp. CnH1-48]
MKSNLWPPFRLDWIATNRYLPMLIAVWATGLLAMDEMNSAYWEDFFPILVQLCFELSPIFICQYFRLNTSGTTSKIWWLLGFAVIPLVALLAYHNSMFVQQHLLSRDVTLFILWLIEGILFFNHWLQHKSKNRFKFALNMDTGLLLVFILLSFMWALLLNSHEDPLNNQPIPFLIDVKRNVLNLGDLIAYWCQMMILYGCLFVLYLIHHHLLIKRVLRQQGVVAYLWMTTLTVLILYPVLSQLALWLPLNQVQMTLIPSGDHNPFDFWNIYIATLVMVISLPVILAFQAQADYRDVAELEQKTLQTELKLLQQQINPHFLFNTLNNLYALSLTKSDVAPGMVLQLANLLRFVVYKGGLDKVSLADEVTYLNDYLALQKVRVDNKCEFTIDLPSEPPGFYLSPLLLIVFLENAFKHGIEPSNQKCWLNVSLTFVEGKLLFICENSLPKQKKAQPEPGIGLDNVRRRLELIYKNQHELDILVSQESYRVTLTLDLNE